MTQPLIVVAGANGKLGEMIVKSLLQRHARVRALVRAKSASENLNGLKSSGAQILEVDFSRPETLISACDGADCVVSALSGLRDVIIDAQSALLDAAVAAKVKRFIPSDFSIDFTQLPLGSNRNLDLRREFQKRIDSAPISATTIFNGAFADMLTGQAPFILFKFNRVLCWGNPDQTMDFTTMQDTANFTAEVAIDPTTPRFLRISGNRVSARDLAAIATCRMKRNFKILKPGNLEALGLFIKVVRKISPDRGELYPAWQGMQYMHNMYSGLAGSVELSNQRYPGLSWTSVSEILEAMN